MIVRMKEFKDDTDSGVEVDELEFDKCIQKGGDVA